MIMSRRALLRTGGGALFALAARPALAMQSPASGKRSLALSNLHTGEKVKLDYWADGA